ncbi:hypothetical protein HMPREF9695_00515 [Afipia broomeae ATCC 49717]|jgi:predicted pyridoxine 5'-phosphate oxidase superfamily flavin-nucleotide-binding protein|uniref:Pyridoxamine 5'-phosphate oxidase putative domain-containing protein n=1 Tax=Afipia broomeae ATCC 49717 TaxID=883078 RepID=K8PST4_9BRAD|nr:hypothetical protein HMPREF9695_00515 [Afipia broomeae ATCC 49717]
MNRFAIARKHPRSVVIVDVADVYLHCSKALKRSDLWNPDKHVAQSTLPTWGEMLRNQGRAFAPAKLIDFIIKQDAKRNLY